MNRNSKEQFYADLRLTLWISWGYFLGYWSGADDAGEGALRAFLFFLVLAIGFTIVYAIKTLREDRE